MAASGDTNFKDFFRIEIIRETIIPESRIYLSDADLLLTFSELPEAIDIDKGATYRDETVAGRSEPWKVYDSSTSTMISFSAKLVAMGQSKSPTIISSLVSVAGQLGNRFGLGGKLGVAATYAPRIYRNIMDLVQDKSGNESAALIIEEVIKKAAMLESLVYTQYTKDGIAFPPPMVNLKYGPLSRRGVIRNVKMRVKGPWEPRSGLPMVIECSVNMEEVNRVPKSHIQVRDFQLSDNGVAGQPADVIPFKSSILRQVSSGFGL